MHHGVRIKDSAIVAAATLSHRYIADRFLPDKAIDLIDEAASKLRIEIDSVPVEIDEIERRDRPARDRAPGALARRRTRRRKERLGKIEKRAGRPPRGVAALKARVAAREGGDREDQADQGAASSKVRFELEQADAPGRPQQGGRAALRRRCRSSEAQLAGGGRSA